MLQPRFGHFRLGDAWQRRTFRQGCGYLAGQGFGIAARKVADQRDNRVIGGVGLGVEGLQLLTADGRDRLGIAVAGVRVRMRAVQALEQRQAGQLAGVLLLVFEAGQQLVLDPRQGVFRKGRLAEHLIEQLHGRLALVRSTEAAQAGDGHVAECAVTEVGAEIFETCGDCADILARYAFIEHGVGQHGQALYAIIMAAAGGKGQLQVEHRQLAGFDEQHLGAFSGLPGLDVQIAAAGRLIAEGGQGFDVGRFGGRCRGWAAIRAVDHQGQQRHQYQ